MNPDALLLIEDTSRETTAAFMKLNQYVDVLIPRGGAGLIRAVVENSTIPVMKPVQATAISLSMPPQICLWLWISLSTPKRRVGVCNACESLLIHREVKDKLLPVLAARLQEKHVEIRGDQEVCELVPDAVTATEEDWGKSTWTMSSP